MQYHLNGFKTGDPAISQPSHPDESAARSSSVPEEVDVLIVGCGPAGLTLAAQLAAFPAITTCIIDQKSGPLELGQADGIACRTMEMFGAFGFVERVLKEAYWVNETTFWKPDGTKDNGVSRHGRVQDVEDGLSEFPHVILNQARVHDFYLDVMLKSANRLEPHYARQLIDLKIDPTSGDAAPSHPVTASLKRCDPDHEGEAETVKARYVVGCDGARSAVRKSLGLALQGDSANQAWGVMDVLAVTDFPDIRLKSFIQSADEGSIVLIPREGGYLVRLYIELDKLSENERVLNRNIGVDQLIAAAQRIMHPYTLDVKDVAWWSVYEIGQRLCDRFDDVPQDQAGTRLPHVFIAGDACHTHSPKAGQGMNVSMQDSFNLGWKLAHVLEGRCPPQLLHSYSAERQAIARELIDFDRDWARMLSAPVKSTADSKGDGVDPQEVKAYFVRHGHYTAGTATRYTASLITGAPTHQKLAQGLVIGKRFHSAPVIRLADAKAMQLGHTVKADGRWRVFAFCNDQDPAADSSSLHALCDYLALSPDSPVRKYTPAGCDIDSVIDVRAVLQQDHQLLDLEAMPAFLVPAKGRYGLRDYEKIFCPELKDGNDIFEMRGIDRQQGCMIVVRPDQYVAHILPLGAYRELSAFFDGVLKQP
ncbi:MAG: FAD-binding monooxygenase [Rhizobiaceae bacterium]|nr:FAD-binding monooxygenase [Rhizobiaceae bacterium]